MSIEQSLERIAAALEKIANPMLQVQTVITPKVDLPAAVKAAAESSTAPAAADERAIVKAELDKRGIKYNPKLSTKGLTDLLKNADKQPELPAVAPTVVKPVPPAVSFLDDGPAEPVKVPTQEDVKSHLKRFAAKFGSDKAIAILEQFKCKDVTSVVTGGLSTKFVEEVLKQEKENERK